MTGLVTDLRNRFNLGFARWAPDPLKRRLGHVLAEPIDLGRARLLRSADPEALRDAHRLEHEILPTLGINDDMPDLFPPGFEEAHLGHGLRYWQYPCQLAPYLVFLSRLPIRRYMEIGVQHGGTFVLTTEYLDRFQPVERAIAVDVMQIRSLRDYEQQRPGVSFVIENSQSERFARRVAGEAPLDLVLIDGDHSREAVRRDWETVHPHAKVVAFHDIVDAYSPGVVETWGEIRREHAGEWEFHEFAEQYPEVLERTGAPHLGLGVAVRRGWPG